MQKYALSTKAALHCAQDVLRYKETHGESPSERQTAKMAQISQKLEHKDYSRLVSGHGAAEIVFLRRREGDLLFKHGSSHHVLDYLIHSQRQVTKSLEYMERQMRQEREQTN